MTAPAEMPGEEEVARALSIADGNHPDACSNDADSQPLWELYLPQARAILALFAPILAEKERAERNRDMWKGQCERQAKTLFDLRMQMLADEGQSRERG